MLLDLQNLFSDNQELRKASEISDNTVKFSKGEITYLPFIAQITETFDNLTSLKLEIETSDSEDFSSSNVLVSSTLVLAELKEGAKFPISYFPKGNKGYMRLKYTIEGTLPTKGKITAGAVMNNDISNYE